MSQTLVFDLGTTYLKAVLFGATGQPLATARRRTPVKRPEIGHDELPVGDFQEAIRRLVSELRSAPQATPHAISRITFSTQANTFALLDRQDQPLTPFIVWTDDRALGLDFPDVNDYAQTGVPTLGHRFSPAKLCWLAHHQPDVFRRAGKICYLSDYLTLWFTGRHVTEAGVAGLSGLLDIHRLAWRDDAMRTLGLHALAWPEPVRAGTAAGAVLPELVTELGLAAGCQFIVGCLDQYAGAVAAGADHDGVIAETTGTVLATVLSAPHFDPHLGETGIYQGPTAQPGRYFRMVFGNTSANLLTAYRECHAPKLSYEELNALAVDAPGNAERLRLVEVSPDLSVMTFETIDGGELAVPTHAQAVDAIYQRVAEELRDQLAQLIPGRRPAQLVSLGGGARSALWRQRKAEVTGLLPTVLDNDEPTAWGAFRLARPAL